MDETSAAKVKTGRRGWRLTGIILGILVVLLLAIRFVGSPIATSLVNKKLAALPGYSGQIRSVQLAVWRAKVTGSDLVLHQNGQENDEPVLRVGHLALTVAPLKLLRGKLSGRIAIDGVEIRMIEAASSTEKKEAKEEKKAKNARRQGGSRAWQGALQQDFPLEMTRFEVSNLKVHFEDRSRPMKSQVLLEDVHLLIKDFMVQPAQAGDLPGKLEMHGRFSGGGELQASASTNAGAAQPQFKAVLEVKNLALPPLHDFLEAYASVDVRSGTFELYVEVNAEGGHYDGYVKPFFRDLEFKAVPDPDKNLAQRAGAKVASAVQNLLKNDEGKVATKAPFKGDFASTEVDVWTTIENLLRNAFVTSLREGFEGQKPSG